MAKAKKKAKAKRPLKARPPLKPNADGVVLLSGGNPQIAKGEGNAPVQAYIKAMPGWKQAIGRKLDRLITRTVPGVKKAVKWNSPFYGVDGKTWFACLHCFNKYVKVTFFQGRNMKPVPPGESRHPVVRYLDIPEGGPFDEAQFVDWIEQACKLPGEKVCGLRGREPGPPC
jgi:hypothetical protein